MTPEQISSIISAMPEGKRKRACLVIAELDLGHDAFWICVQNGDFLVGPELLLRSPAAISYCLTVDMLADMIWEGGA